VESEIFRVRAALPALLPLVEAIADPLAGRRDVVGSPATGERPGVVALAGQSDAEKHDNHAALREARKQASGMSFSADALVARGLRR
jgi:hypothetical protein